MRIAVTGGAGFIGAATVRAGHAAGHHMIVVDRTNESSPAVVVADVTDGPGLSRALAEAGAEHVIHLAGVLGTHELFDDPHRAVDVNVHGTLNVLEACSLLGAGYTSISMPPVFNSVYTATKVCADRLATAWHESMGLRTSHVVAYNAYGPGQKHGPGHPQKIIPTFATEAWADRPIPIWGDGTQTVDLVHADDLGRMLVAATAYGNDEVFDGGTGYATTVNHVADYVNRVVAEETGWAVGSVQHLPMRRGEKPTTIVAEGRGWDLLGWSPAPPFTGDALRETILSYRPQACADSSLSSWGAAGAPIPEGS